MFGILSNVISDREVLVNVCFNVGHFISLYFAFPTSEITSSGYVVLRIRNSFKLVFLDKIYDEFSRVGIFAGCKSIVVNEKIVYLVYKKN